MGFWTICQVSREVFWRSRQKYLYILSDCLYFPFGCLDVLSAVYTVCPLVCLMVETVGQVSSRLSAKCLEEFFDDLDKNVYTFCPVTYNFPSWGLDILTTAYCICSIIQKSTLSFKCLDKFSGGLDRNIYTFGLFVYTFIWVFRHSVMLHVLFAQFFI